ncbi:MAG: lipopolysaccharide transport periplasmic protein LptA [Pseudomonadales bacterium]|nr:lipopolysaccharide transport periplasmic protein LptA [Pseudomonadales bacterium]MCP5183351.1 lipopolysaccharide transport periplasmic protein LptA [Pseudomonadales bacterium]
MRSSLRVIVRRGLASLLFLPAAVLAVGSDQPWEVQSDSYEILLDQRQITYVGNVVASQGEYRIRASRLRAYLNEKNEIIRLEADGSAATQAELEALNQPQETRLFGDRLLYDMRADKVTARGHTRLFRGTDTMDAHELVYNLTDEKVVAMRNTQERVRVVMYPEGTKPGSPIP